MGREIKRVSIDFNWPIKAIWKGYINPYRYSECSMCKGSGLNKATQKLSDSWYGFKEYTSDGGWGKRLEQEDVQALLDAGRLMDFTRVPINDEQREVVRKKIADGGNSWLPYDNGYIPTADEINEWSRNGMGHDSINQWICVKAKANRLGVYGECELCRGAGHYFCEDKYHELSEAWVKIEPPDGDGYQMWETTSEGSPISPVCETAEELARWLYDNNASSFGTSTCSYESWLEFIRGPGWAPSMIMTRKEIKPGVEMARLSS